MTGEERDRRDSRALEPELITDSQAKAAASHPSRNVQRSSPSLSRIAASGFRSAGPEREGHLNPRLSLYRRSLRRAAGRAVQSLQQLGETV